MTLDEIKKKYMMDSGEDALKRVRQENKRIVKEQTEKKRECIKSAKTLIEQLKNFDADRADNYGLPAQRVINKLSDLRSKLQECNSLAFHLRS